MVAINKTWEEKTHLERLKTIADIQINIFKGVEEEQRIQKSKRRLILGVSEDKPITKRKYTFGLPDSLNLKEEDEEKVKRVLENIAKERYANKPEKYKIFEDRDTKHYLGMWWYLELRWPSHYAGFIDSIYFLRNDTLLNKPGEINICFARSKREISSSIKRKKLDEEAQQIYEQIKSQL